MRVLHVIATGALLFAMAGCDPEGACESVHSFTGTSDVIYRCYIRHGSSCGGTTSGVNIEGEPYTVTETFSANQSCGEVGYPYECSYHEYLSNPECDDRQPPSSGSESGGGCGTSSYGGPYYDDIQVESQCEAIYAYGCSEEAVDTGCEILDQWEANGVPNVCPYCD